MNPVTVLNHRPAVREHGSRIMLPIVYALSCFLAVAGFASQVWRPLMAGASEPGSGSVAILAAPIYLLFVALGGAVGTAYCAGGVAVLITYAIRYRVPNRALLPLGVANGLLSGMLVMGAANTGAGPAITRIEPIVALNLGAVAVLVLGIVIALLWRWATGKEM